MNKDWCVSLRNDADEPVQMKLPLGRGCSITLETGTHTGRHIATVSTWFMGSEHAKSFMADSAGKPLAESTGWAEARTKEYLEAGLAKFAEAFSNLKGQVQEGPAT